ncbi:uncharacterized protein LOC142771279 [Rhipicephalus microplus]|uniref:uncharacterized protein LOC142771279 n=1 Tax=Rhipicephalus microplus TaxID=6941 RepID=UPI003F6B80AE
MMALSCIVVSSVALYVCLTNAAVVEKRNVIPPLKGNVGDSCDGNNDCRHDLCCYRPDVESGTVCGKRGEESQPCSNVTLEEDSTTGNPDAPSCREDEEAAGITEETYSAPYDGACPCNDGLFCKFTEATKRSENSDSAPLGTCQSVQLQENLI